MKYTYQKLKDMAQCGRAWRNWCLKPALGREPKEEVYRIVEMPRFDMTGYLLEYRLGNAAAAADVIATTSHCGVS